MEHFKTIFLLLFGLRIVTDFAFKILNFRYLKRNTGKVPAVLGDLVDIRKLQQIDSYNAAKIKFDIIHFLFENTVVFLFLFTPFFPAYTAFFQRLPFSYIFQGLLFFFALGCTAWLIGLPLNYYFHFHIEKSFGFNKYSQASWLWDTIKNFLMNTVISGIIVIFVLWFTGDQFSFTWMKILYGWLIALVLILTFAYFLPVLVIPVFYQLKPVTDESLRQKIESLVIESGLHIKRILMADESRKSTHVNAEFSGIGKNKTIILFDTLVNNYTEDEILAILAHEIGHGKGKHLWKMIAISCCGAFLFILFAGYLLSSELSFIAFGINVIYAKFYIAYLFFFEIITFFIHPVIIRFSQKCEYEADIYSRRLLHSSEPLIAVFKKFILLELGNINIHPWYEKIYYSHPSLLNRIQALKN